MSPVEAQQFPGKNRLGGMGFVLSLFGVGGVVLAGLGAALDAPFGNAIYLIGVAVTFLNLPGILLSAVGLCRPPRRLAAWGLALGMVGAMYLPTLCLPFFRR